MSLDKTIPGGIYMAADGTYHDAWGKPVADPNKVATGPEVEDKGQKLEIETPEGVITVEVADESELVTVEEADGEIVTLEASAAKNKKKKA